MLEADVIGVIHDVSNTWTRDRLDPKVLRLLYLYPKKNSFLILNKVRLYHAVRIVCTLPLKKWSFIYEYSSIICSSHVTLGSSLMNMYTIIHNINKYNKITSRYLVH
jgi:hypothetical protein